MKKILLSFGIIAAVLFISCCGLLDVSAEAKTKKKTTTTVSAEEQLVNDLTAYLNALIAQGADEATIEFAKQALENAQKALDAKKQADLIAAATQAAVDEASKSATQPAVAFPFIFVGDSRFVQMHEALGNTGVYYVAENSKGYKWLSEEALSMIDPYVGRGTKIVINLGVNDPGNADNYIALVNSKAIEWRAKGAKVYYATVNPVSENPYTTSAQVDMINGKLVTGLIGVNIIDTNTYLKTTGYRLVDGLHFDGPTYYNIYTYIMSNLK